MNGWKVVAIIFILVAIGEAVAFGLLLNLGLNIVEKETECQVNICGGYEAFAFDSMENMCSCYIDNEVVKEEYIR